MVIKIEGMSQRAVGKCCQRGIGLQAGADDMALRCSAIFFNVFQNDPTGVFACAGQRHTETVDDAHFGDIDSFPRDIIVSGSCNELGDFFHTHFALLW